MGYAWVLEMFKNNRSMSRKKYIKGALVCSRNTKFEKGMGIILYGSNAAGFQIHWFEKPGHIDRWDWLTMKKIAGKYVCFQTIRQIKLLKKN